MRYALIHVATSEITRTLDSETPPPSLPAGKGLQWVELVETPLPAYNSATHGVRAAPHLFAGGQCTKQWEVFPLPAEEVTQRAASLRAAAVESVNEACAAIYTRVGRFTEEYKSREAQALAYQAAGFTGDVPRQVAAFATPAGVSATVATNTILAQAAHLRGALETLGELRMRKYEFATATDVPALQAQILASIAAVAAALG